MRNTEDSAPYEKLCTQPMIDAEARQAENGCLSKRERRNEVRSERDRARSHDAKAKKENKKAGGVLLSHVRATHYPRRWGP